MKIIKELKIKNYKGLEDVKFPCDHVNIFIGPNNTGKSSVLESIWLGISSLSNFEDVLGKELIDIVGDEDKNRFLTRLGTKKANIELEITKDKKIKVEILELEKGIPDEFIKRFLPFVYKYTSEYLGAMYQGRPYYSEIKSRVYLDDRFENSILGLSREVRRLERLSRKGEVSEKIPKLLEKFNETIESELEKFRIELINSEKIFISSKINNSLISLNVMMSKYSGEIPINRGSRLIRKIPIITNSHDLEEDISELHEKLVKTKKLSGVLDKLSEEISYFEDIREVEGEFFVVLKDKKEPLPLSLMGDGFKALLKLSFMAPLLNKGVILFEEPEHAMHPRYLEVLAEEILSNAKNSQFFITTHSLEFLELLLEKGEERKQLDSINIFRMDRSTEGKISSELIPGSEGNEEMKNIKTDLRSY
ncbi:ATP/GTP phosphatase [archaeon BMS3Bbin16]|nr:ATP/GTP phosphatase [archaeon BMS3Bbin16]